MRLLKRWPASTHSFCTRLWKPCWVRQWGSHITCTRLDTTQLMSRSSASVTLEQCEHLLKAHQNSVTRPLFYIELLEEHNTCNIDSMWQKCHNIINEFVNVCIDHVSVGSCIPTAVRDVSFNSALSLNGFQCTTSL